MKLFKLQKRATRIILNPKPRHPSIDAFNQLNWVPFYIEIDLRRCILAHKRINGVAPEYLKKMLVLNNEIHSRSTRSAGLLFRTPNYYRRTEGGKRFSTYACKLWNRLPLNIKCIASVEAFKRSIINIFLNYQNEHKLFTTFAAVFPNQ